MPTKQLLTEQEKTYVLSKIMRNKLCQQGNFQTLWDSNTVLQESHVIPLKNLTQGFNHLYILKNDSNHLRKQTWFQMKWLLMKSSLELWKYLNIKMSTQLRWLHWGILKLSESSEKPLINTSKCKVVWKSDKPDKSTLIFRQLNSNFIIVIRLINGKSGVLLSWA